MTTVIQKWGNSMAVRLPKDLAQAVALRQGTPVTLEVKEGRILVTPVSKPVYRLDRLVPGITEKNRHKAIETGKPRGHEVW